MCIQLTALNYIDIKIYMLLHSYPFFQCYQFFFSCDFIYLQVFFTADKLKQRLLGTY